MENVLLIQTIQGSLGISVDGCKLLLQPVFNQNLNENCQNRWILICFSSKSIGVIAPISP